MRGPPWGTAADKAGVPIDAEIPASPGRSWKVVGARHDGGARATLPWPSDSLQPIDGSDG